jgi:hypothetical protein
MIAFLQALNGGRIVRRATLELMHQWHSWEFLAQYGYGTIYVSQPWLVSTVTGFASLWGHSGSTGSFLYYSEDLDFYLAGTIDQTESRARPFFLMWRIMKAVRAKQAAVLQGIAIDLK